MTDRIYLPDVSDDENALVNGLLDQLARKSSRNLLRARYYDGKQAIRQVGTVVPPIYYRMGLVLGWSAKAVDILARRCNLDGFVWADGDLDSLGVQEIWEDNLFDSETNSAIVSGLIHGVCFLVNTRGGDGEPEALVHAKDALNATGEWNARTRRMDNLLSIAARDQEGNPTSLALYLDGETIVAERDGGKWSVDRSEHDFGVPVEAMVYKPRLGRPFGMSRISQPVMSLQDAALRSVIRMEGHADIYSYPDMWLLGADESMFVNEDGSKRPTWDVMMGRIKAIPDDEEALPNLERADVQQFPASSPEPHLAHLNMLAKAFARETSLPDTSVAITDVANPTSAESYNAAQHELVSEAEGATDDWSQPLRRSMIRGLAISNGLSEVPPEWRTIDTKWRSPLFESRAAQADAGMKQISAVPWLAETEVGLEMLGLNEQQIKRALAEKRRLAGRGVLDTLKQAAEARNQAMTADTQAVDQNAVAQ
ncbi:phage portal protein [Prescottella agglutinans]|uniref:Portal protein n=1 Tax=Prescottella agglutinans TaxID=1644129 RepID=A0ABT6M6G6_9NOCA|nr:phage portal protein [Prescottella agglutinans]MDH6279351.1 hypothetical protein [Prescottella agglutinans]